MIRLNRSIVKIEHFPDGTQRININEPYTNEHVIDWIYEKEEELSAIIYITRHLKNLIHTKFVALRISYLPNARMDRVHKDTEIFTLKGFADVINWLDFKYVEILDVHSNVGAALIDRAYIKTPEEYIKNAIQEIEKLYGEVILYFPDDGAAKRYSKLFPRYKYCYGEKNREWETGKIIGLNIINNNWDLDGATILMIDDIISYGGSLYYSAKALKENGAEKIFAYATHTENSILNKEKGTLIKLLEDGTVEKLFTTDSLFTGEHEKIKIVEEYDYGCDGFAIE